MRLIRVRFAVRRLMIVVAVAAVASGVAALLQCGGQDLRSAEGPTWKEMVARTTMGQDDRQTTLPVGAAIEGITRPETQWAVIFASDRGQARYHVAMKARDEWAAGQPWVAVAPDSPEPE